ncbi:MAG: hypothetical protein AAGB93_07010 [Planctomycetota bacterium]
MIPVQPSSLRPRRVRSAPARSRAAWAAVVSAWAVLAACGDVTEIETRTGDEGSPIAGFVEGGGAPPFLELVEDAKDSTAFRGVRRVRSVVEKEVLETRQTVGADGQGRFAIELLETLSLTSNIDPLTFPVTFENSARFQWQVRDFRIRDLDRTAQSYSIHVLPTSPTVAGIPCARVEFFRSAPIGGRPGHYEVDIDPRTGFVLAWREFDEFGQPIVESEYETFEYGGDTSDMVLRDRLFPAKELDLAGDLGGQAGMNVLYPDVAPLGFEVVAVELMEVPKSIGVSGHEILEPGSWVRFLMTDGIETITFVHDDDFQPSALSVVELKAFRQGAWEILFGDIQGTSIVIAGRVSDSMIRRVIQSAF